MNFGRENHLTREVRYSVHKLCKVASHKNAFLRVNHDMVYPSLLISTDNNIASLYDLPVERRASRPDRTCLKSNILISVTCVCSLPSMVNSTNEIIQDNRYR